MDWRLVCVLVVLAAGCLANAAPSNNETTSDLTDKPSNNGLGGLYSMTRNFIDLVMTKKSVITALKDEAGGKDISKLDRNAYLNVAKSAFIGYAICIAIGIIFIIVIPVVGCCFCGCRFSGNCGGTPREVEKGPDRLKKTCFSIFFIIIVAFMLGSVVCIFLNNDMIHDQTSKTSDNRIIHVAKKNLNKTEMYINDVIQELGDVVTKGFDTIVNSVVKTLGETAKTAKDKLAKATNATDALNNVKKLAESLEMVNKSLTKVKETTKALKDGTASLDQQLDKANNNLTNILKDCITEKCNTTRAASASALKLDADFDEVDDVSPKLDTVVQVDWKALLDKIKEGSKAMDDVTKNISSKTESATADVEKNINGTTRTKIINQIQNSSEEIRKMVTFDKIRNNMIKQEDNVDEFGNYIYWAGLVLGCITLLIVLLYFLGLLFVTCCGRDGSSCNQRTGTNFLMAGVGFTFIFAVFLMLLTLLLFIIGAPLYSGICRYTADLSDPTLTKEFDVLLVALKSPLEKNLSIASVMEKCSKDASLYNAANLGDHIDIVKYLDVDKYPALNQTITNLKSTTFDLGEVNILNDDTKNKLYELINGSLDTINFTSFRTQVKRDVTAGGKNALSELATQMNAVADELQKVNQNETVDQLREQASRLQDIKKEVSALETKKTELGNAIDQLETTLTANGGFTNHTQNLLDSLQAAENKIKDESSTLLSEIVGGLAEDLLKDISANLKKIANELINNVGKCKTPLDIIQSTIDIGCKSVLGPFNALWFSLGWFIFFSIPGLIFAVKLVGVYRANKVDNDDNKSFDHEHNDEYYRSGGAMNTVNNPQSEGHANQGYQSDNYHKDNHQRSSRHRREHRQHHHRQPDYNSKQRSPQHYDNRGGHN